MQRQTRTGPPIRLDGIVLRETSYAPAFEQPTHYHRSSSVTLVYAGSLEERVGTRTESAAPLSVVIKPAGTEHANRVGKHGARTLQIELGPTGGGPAEPTLAQWRWLHAGTPARAFMDVLCSLVRSKADITLTETAVYDFLGTLATDERLRDRTAPPTWLHRIAQEIDTSFAAPRRVSALAKSADVHPVFLARCYRRHFGTSITTRIRHRRVQAAAGRLTTSTDAVSTIAHASGYTDQSHLCRELKRATGFSPVQYRTLARSA